MSELTKILHDMASGRKNKSGDYWSMQWCAEAAYEIKKLTKERDKYKQALANIAHATREVQPNDGGNHENAYSLAVGALKDD